MVQYSRGHIRSVLDGLNIEVVQETEKRYNCLCPFHHNTYTPAFSISKDEGLWICFNEHCAERGNLEQLVERLTDRTRPEALRYITNRGDNLKEMSLAEVLDEAFTGEVQWPEFPDEIVEQLVKNFWLTPKAQEYMYGRGFDDKTLESFQIGFSPKRNGQVTYPVHTPKGDICVGVVGRGINTKFFDNSRNLPKKRVLYNLHRARRESNSVYVVESGFDAQRLHQAGLTSVVATLGSQLSEQQIRLMERNFTEIIVFSDNDEAGMAMRKHIMRDVKSAAVLHAAWDYDTLYPDEAGNRTDGNPPKDAGDLSIEQIQHMGNNPLSPYEIGLP